MSRKPKQPKTTDPVRRKKRRRIVLLVLAVILTTGITVGLVALRSSMSRAYVRPLNELGYPAKSAGGERSGAVSEGEQQREIVDSENTVAEVFVKKGQTVKAGDKLFAYDADLLQLAVDNGVLAVNIASNSLQLAQQRLTEYESLKPVEKTSFSLPDNWKLPAPMSGDGSAKKPYRYLCTPETVVTAAQLNGWAKQGKTAVLVVVDAKGKTLGEWTVDPTFPPVEEGTYWSVIDQSEWFPPEPEGVTPAEKAKLVADQRLTVSKLENEVATAKLELEIARKKLEGAAVTAKMDGTVTAVGDPLAPPADGEPFCVVTGFGGMVVQGTVSEDERASLKVGDKFTVTDYLTDSRTTAAVVSVDDVPSTVGYEGMMNLSYYAFTVALDDPDGFVVGDEVGLQPYLDPKAGDLFVVPSIYVRSDDKGSYMMVDDGSGRLERRSVTCRKITYDGGDYYGASEVILLTGVTGDDLIAFPYGSKGKAGTRTTERPSLLDEF